MQFFKDDIAQIEQERLCLCILRLMVGVNDVRDLLWCELVSFVVDYALKHLKEEH